MHGSGFVADLALVLGVGAVTSVTTRWLRQPAVLGYLLAGLIVGPYIPVPLFADVRRVEALSEFGVILVMFSIGLEFRLRKLFALLPISGVTAVVQISALIWAGFSVGRLLGWGTVESLFLGGCIGISSTMVVSRVFDQRPVAADVREYVLGVLILQDVAAIALIAALTGVAAGAGLSAREIGLTLGKLAGVLVAMVAGGLLVVPRLVRIVSRLESKETMIVASGGLCFGLAMLAEHLGYSVALGAFIAGLLVSESGEGEAFEHVTAPVKDLFAAVFFVSIGMTVDPRVAIQHIDVSAVVFAVVVLGQLLSVTLAGLLSGNGLRRSATAGLALGQIGEFAFIIAGIGAGARVARPELQPVVVTVALLTAFSTPLLLGRAGWLVCQIDRRLPKSLQTYLTIYAAWLERLRAPADEGNSLGDDQRRRLRRLVRASVIDGAVLVALAAVAPAGSSWLGALARRQGLGAPLDALAPAAAGLLVAVPFSVALIRNALATSALACDIVFRGPDPTDDRRLPAAQLLLRRSIQLLFAVTIGIPILAAIRPFVPAPYNALIFAALLLLVTAYLWRTSNQVATQARSGAERIASALAQAAGPAEEISVPSVPESDPLPNLYRVAGVRLARGAYAVGRTLIELNLRALTGASVIAIHRGGEVITPRGRETLDAGDVLALTGPRRATTLADRVLRTGPEALANTAPTETSMVPPK